MPPLSFIFNLPTALVPFVQLILEKNFEKINRIVSIANFCEESTYEQINNDVIDVAKNPLEVVTSAVTEILRLGEDSIIEKFNTDYIHSVEKLTLEFNVENNSTNDNEKKNLLQRSKQSVARTKSSCDVIIRDGIYHISKRSTTANY